MPYIQHPDDIDWYRENFGDIWQSASLTYSSVDVDGVQIPNGELSFSREPEQESIDVLYREGALSIYELVSNSPFDLLDQIIDGEIPTDNGPVEIESELFEHNPGSYFQDDLRDGRVRETRPKMEVNATVHMEIPECIEDEYSEVVDALDEQLMQAEEPYFDLGRAEGYYFDYIFRSDRDNPAILLFADTGMEFEISESGTLEVVSPTSLFEDLYVSVLPQKPYDEHKGWRIDLKEEQLESVDTSRSRYTEDLELEAIDNLYAILYHGDRRVTTIEHHTGNSIPENPRFEIMQAFDQDGNLQGYLAGHNANVFEVAVVNALSTAGWIVQWYGDDNFVIPSFSEDVPGAQHQEIDVIAYHPENTQILCIECTNQDISNKEQILDRTEVISSVLDDHFIPTDIGIFEAFQTVPCVATPQNPEELNDDVVDELDKKGITILHRERLHAIYAASQDTTETVDVDTQFYDVI